MDGSIEREKDNATILPPTSSEFLTLDARTRFGHPPPDSQPRSRRTTKACGKNGIYRVKSNYHGTPLNM